MALALNKINILIIVLIITLLSICSYKVIRWKMYLWVPSYFVSLLSNKEHIKGVKHIIFVFVDHYEPGSGEKGVIKNRQWLANYNKLISRHFDSNGRIPQHTWFYAYEQKNNGVISDLANEVYNGRGEIEFHWHHKNDDNKSFQVKLSEGIDWFNQYGSLIDKKGVTAFAFIHGNWSLDNSRGENMCGVNNELEILKKTGCYADFTFPSFGQISQPALVNSIYYATDDDYPKSYDHGNPVAVGRSDEKNIMIFQGPITLTDYGAVELDPYPNKRKIDSWVDANIHVTGRPEWVFVKVYTHGIQSSEVLFSKIVDDMYNYLENNYAKGNYRLHYMTAREAFNIVKAAEDGKTGDPFQYRDYKIKPPLNKYFKY